MSEETHESRLEQLENEVRTLRVSLSTGTTMAAPIFGVIAWVVFIVFMAKLPLPGHPSTAERLGIAIASFVVGCGAIGIAVKFVTFALKAIIEVTLIVLILINCLTGALIWAFSSTLTTAYHQLVPDSHQIQDFWAVFAIAVLVLLLTDVLMIFILYPLAKLAGSSIIDEINDDFQ